MPWRLIRKEALPRPGVLALVGVALGLVVIGLSCSGLFTIYSDVEDPGGTAAFMFSCFLLPLVLMLLVVGTVREKRPIPRALIWLLISLLIGLAAILIALAMARDPDLGVGGSGFVFLLFGAPLALVALAPAIYFTAKGWGGLKETLRKEREKLALDLVEARGTVTLAALGRETRLDEPGCVSVLETARNAGRFDGVIDAPGHRVFAAATLNAKRLELLGMLQARGQIRVDDLALEMGVPLDLLKSWIYGLVQHGQFSGYINWEEGVLYSAEGKALGEAAKCPNCGGELGLAGKGIVLCRHCGAEVFL